MSSLHAPELDADEVPEFELLLEPVAVLVPEAVAAAKGEPASNT